MIQKGGNLEEIKNKLNRKLSFFDKKECNDSYITHDELFERYSIVNILLQIIDDASLPDNIYSIEKLNEYYQMFIKKKKESLFCVEDLFRDGWLIESIGEWSHNSKVRELCEHKYYGDEKEKQIFEFLFELSKLNSRDQMWLEINSTSKVIKELSKIDKMFNIEGLIKYEIVEKINDKYYINPYCNLWVKYGDLVLAYMWDYRIVSVDLEKRFNLWIRYWQGLTQSYIPDRYINDIDTLYEACLKELESELEKSDWHLEEIIYNRKRFIENEEIRKREAVNIEKIPLTLSGKISFFENKVQRTISPYKRVERYCSLCSRQYWSVSQELRNRFLRCLEIPHLNMNFWIIEDDHSLFIECLNNKELFLNAVVSIWELLVKNSNKNSYIDEIWNDCDLDLFKFLSQKMLFDANNSWKNVLIQLIQYLNNESQYYKRIKSFTFQNYLQKSYLRLFSWYETEIMEVKDINLYIFDYFFYEFEKSEGKDAISNFEVLVSLVNVQVEQDYYVRMYQAYVKFINKFMSEDTLVAQLDFKLFNNKLWIKVLQMICNSNEKMNEFLTLLEVDTYEKIVKEKINESPILNVGKIVTAHLYLTACILDDLRDELSENRKKTIEEIFIKNFFGFQIKHCEIFTGESIRLLNSNFAISKCMASISVMSIKSKNELVLRMEKTSISDLIFWVEYIKDNEVREKIINGIIQRINEDFQENIYFLPTFQALIEKFVMICMKYENPGLIGKLKELHNDIQCEIEKKGNDINIDYRGWLDSVKYRIYFLEGKEEEIVKSNSRFYKGYYYLASDDPVKIEQAVEIYKWYLDEKSCSGSLNYFAACVLMVHHQKESKEDYNRYLSLAKTASQQIRKNNILNDYQKKILYSNELFLFQEIGDSSSFWSVFKEMPDDLKIDIECAQYVIKMYYSAGDFENADLLIEEIEKIYGRSSEIDLLKKNAIQQIVTRPKEIAIEENEVEKLKNALMRLKDVTENKVALIRLPENINDIEEAHLVYMVGDAMKQLEFYSDNLLRNNETVDENTYNRTIKILFNQSQTEVWNFSMEDQTQAGTTGTIQLNGQSGMGSLDLIIKRKKETLSILEGIKLKNLKKEDVRKHIMKMYGYNEAKVSTVFILIYSESEKPKNLWKRYEAYLNELKNKSDNENCGIVNIIKYNDLGVVKSGNLKGLNYICMTSHKFKTGIKMNMYHIMIDVVKFDQKEVAKKARET